jgi:hypothetical protein
MKKVLRFILIIVMLLLAASWLSTVAYGQTNSDVEQKNIKVEAAPPEASPKVDFFGNAIGGVKAGDLFYIDATGSPLDISLDLYITNPDELIHYLRYLILKVAVYMEDAGGQWQQITSQNGTALPDAYITLQNSPVNFTLPGLARYKITIESGSYHSFPFHPNNGDISPSFYLNVSPM